MSYDLYFIVFYVYIYWGYIDFSEPKVSPATFCHVFPFHIMFDRELIIVQTGTTVARVIPRVNRPGCRITDILDPVRLS